MKALSACAIYWASTVLLTSIVAVPELRIGKVVPSSLKSLYTGIGNPASKIIDLHQNLTKLELVCADRVPVKWVYDGEEAPHRINITAERNASQPSLPFQVKLGFDRVSSMLTGNYSCQPIEDDYWNFTAAAADAARGRQNPGAWIYIYGQNPEWMEEYKFKLLLHGRFKDIHIAPNVDFVRLPCSVSDPSANVILKRKLESKSGYQVIERNEWLQFNPTSGFKFYRKHADFRPGVFFCITGPSDVVTINLLEQAFEVQPESEQLEVFMMPNKSNALKASCFSSKPVTMAISGTEETSPRIQRIEGRNSNGSIPFNYMATLEFANVTTADYGSIKCIEKVGGLNSSTGDVLHSWSYLALPSLMQTKIGWGNYTIPMNGQPRIFRYCWAQTTNSPLVRFVSCKNDMECRIKKRCIEMGSILCDDSAFRICPGGCGRGEQLRTSGFYHCEGDGLDILGREGKVSWNLFGASHLTNYTKPAYSRDDLLSPANHADVLAILEQDFLAPNSTVHLLEGEVHNFTCVGSAFLFSKGFEWHVREDDADSAPYTLNSGIVKKSYRFIAELVASKETLMDEGLIKLESSVKIHSTRIKSITCMAYLWDPKILRGGAVDVMASTINVVVSATRSPEFISDVFKRSYNFDINDKDTSNKWIRCPVTGRPFPEITWLKDGNSTLPYGAQSKGSRLIFHFTDYAHAGKYTCIASNLRGTVHTDFNVGVYASMTSRMQTILGVAIPGGVVMLVLLVVIIAFWRKIRHQRKLLRNLTEEEIKEFEVGNPDCFDPNVEISDQAHLLAYNGSYEFPKDQLNFSMRDKLGAGEFGLVLKGYAANIFPTEQQTLVAVKTIKATADITQFKSLLTELKIMSRIGRHPNLVNLLGAVTKEIANREVFIIVEYCANGDLRSYLRKQQAVVSQMLDAIDGAAKPHPVGLPEFVNWAYQIASGMQFLADQRVIHGDLAARNVLLTDTLQAKVGDFGMSRRLYAQNYVKKHKMALPWKWMALESLRDMEFSTKSDVWAYGVTLWEIFSLGAVPYPGISWTMEFMHELANGLRLGCPPYSTGSIYNIMTSCWDKNPNNRPSFDTLMEQFSALMKQYAIVKVESPEVPRRNTKPIGVYVNVK